MSIVSLLVKQNMDLNLFIFKAQKLEQMQIKSLALCKAVILFLYNDLLKIMNIFL